MIADQQHGRRQLRKPADARRKFALVSLIGTTAAKGVASKYHQIDITVAGEFDHLVHTLQEIVDAAADTTIGIGLAVILHADVHIGKVQDADGFAHILP